MRSSFLTADRDPGFFPGLCVSSGIFKRIKATVFATKVWDRFRLKKRIYNLFVVH